MELNIQADATINQYELDKEARKLPSIIAKYNEALRLAVADVNKLQFQLDKEEAVARIDARKALNRDGTKPTQAMIDDQVTVLPSIMQLRRLLADAEKERDYIKAAISVLEVKKNSLNNLVQLHISAYYNATKVANDTDAGKYKEADVKRRLSVDYDARADEETEDLNKALGRRN